MLDQTPGQLDREAAGSSAPRSTRSARPTASRTSRWRPARARSSPPTSTSAIELCGIPLADPDPRGGDGRGRRSALRRRARPARRPGRPQPRRRPDPLRRPGRGPRADRRGPRRRGPGPPRRGLRGSRSARSWSRAGSRRSTPPARAPPSPRRPARPAGSGRSAPSTAPTCSSSSRRSAAPATSRPATTRCRSSEFTRFMPIPVAVGNTTNAEAAFALMEQGAAAVFVGVGPGAACTTREVLGIGVPQVTAISDVAAARDAYFARDRPLRPGRRRRRDASRRRAGQGDRRRRRRADARLAARPRRGGARAAARTGAWPPRRRRCRAGRGSRSARSARSSGSCSARPT